MKKADYLDSTGIWDIGKRSISDILSYAQCPGPNRGVYMCKNVHG